MNTETRATSQPEQALRHRLHELTPETEETRAAWLGRAAIVADEFDDQILAKEELQYIERLLPSWRFSTTQIRAKRFGIARRSGPPDQKQRMILGEHNNPPKRLVGLESDNIVLMSRVAIHAEDAASIFRIEQANDTFARSAATQPPKPYKQLEGINSGNTNDRPVLYELSGLRLTQREKEVLQLLPLTTPEIAQRLGIEESAITKRVDYAIARNKKGNTANRADFLTLALQGGLIDMSLLPPGKSYTLTELEHLALRDHTFDNLETITQQMELTSTAIASDIRKSIRKKLGTPMMTKTQTFLIGKRDGII